MKGNNLPFKISIGDKQFSLTVDEQADVYFDNFSAGIVETGNPKKDGNTWVLKVVLRNQLEKGKSEELTSPIFKLLLRTEGLDEQALKVRLRKSFEILKGENFIDGQIKEYFSIFLADITLQRKVKWCGRRKELKYLVCKLACKDFTELTPDSDTYQLSEKGSGITVFDDNKRIFEKAANSFLDKNGNTFPKRSIQFSNEKTLISALRKKILNNTAKVISGHKST